MVDWGTVPEWLAAIGTVGALALGGWLLREQLGEFRELDRQRSRQAEEDRRAAAASVSAWWEYDVSKGWNDGFWALRARNAGSEPVHNCTVLIGPHPEPGGPPAEYYFPILPPETTLFNVIQPHEVAVWLDEPAGLASREVWVEVTFTDPSGQHWRRDQQGELERLESLPTKWEG